MHKIGFIGLGHMGLPMALNLVKAGLQVTGFDLQPTALDAFVAGGGIAAKQLADAARDQDVFITMLQQGSQVKSVCLGDAGLYAVAKKSALHIDCSSIDVITSRAVQEAAHDLGIYTVDAPVSGGVAGAANAGLTFMVGGLEPSFLKAKRILEHMGKKIIHTGEAGSGQAAKICNNMILGISMIAISEAFTLGEQLGLAPKKLFEVVENSSGQCWAMSRYVPVPGILDNVPANHEYQPGFTAAMMLKDLRLSQQSAETVGVNTAMGAQAANLYQQFADQGLESLDFSAIIQWISKK